MNKTLKAFLAAIVFLIGCANSVSFLFGTLDGMDHTILCDHGTVPAIALPFLPGYLVGCTVGPKLVQPVELPWRDNK